MRSKNRLLILIIAACICLCAAASFAEVIVPDRPVNHVVDLAGIIDDSAEAGLNRYLLELEQKTTAQMVILTISSLEGGSIDDLSLNIAHDRWKLGQKGKDNGVLLLVA
ncbi:MAG: TPM domain-containing protein, partial [Nitrospirota bacterium]|nr:TPM domain-containing protein [Nitrospirota bacterium]